MERYSARNFDNEQGAKNLYRIATTRIGAPGHHHLRVRSPHPEQPLLILVGEEMIPGRKLWKRLRGE